MAGERHGRGMLCLNQPLLGYLRRALCLLGIPRVESRNAGIAVFEDIFDRMEISLTEVFCLRGIQAMVLE
jgi:hypothetical protein